MKTLPNLYVTRPLPDEVMRIIGEEFRLTAPPETGRPGRTALLAGVREAEAVISTLAERMECVRSNVTQLVDRLEEERLVRRVSDPRDRRSIRAEITKEGRERYAAAIAVVEKTEGEVFAHLPEQQRETLFELLRSLKPVATR